MKFHLIKITLFGLFWVLELHEEQGGKNLLNLINSLGKLHRFA